MDQAVERDEASQKPQGTPSGGHRYPNDDSLAVDDASLHLTRPSTEPADKRRLNSSSVSIASNESSSRRLHKLFPSSKRRRRKQREAEEAQLVVPELHVPDEDPKDGHAIDSDGETNDLDHESAPTLTKIESPDSKDLTTGRKSTRRRASLRRGSSTGNSSTRERLKDIFSPSSRNSSPSNAHRSNNGSNLFKRSKTGLPPSSASVESFKQRARTESDPASQISIEFPSMDASIEQSEETVQSPETTVTPPTPELHSQHVKQTLPAENIGGIIENAPKNDSEPSNATAPSPSVVVSPSGNMISHRRVRSAAASSTLPSSTKSPTSKAPEESKPRNQPSGIGGGFFASMFSAAQSAIGMNQTPSTPPESQQAPQSSTEAPSTSQNDLSSDSLEPKKRMAVETLGEGELNFSDLGIDATSGGVITTKDGVTFTQSNPLSLNTNASMAQRDELSARIEELRSARAVSKAYDDTAEARKKDSASTKKGQRGTSIPRSIRAESASSQRSPSATNSTGGASKKSHKESLKSQRRHRKSSGATTNTLGAAGLGLSGAAARPGIQRLTGFAVASKKRNKDFHQLFRSVPEDDYLIEDYSCALQREIILAGRIYISEGHICFSSNILGWVTTLVISFDEIIAIEKETTAMVFPNAIAIQTLHARPTFRSLLSREATYDLMVSIWRINHPTSLRSFVNGTRIKNGTGDKTEKLDEKEIGSISGSELSEYEIYDEDEDESGLVENGSFSGTDQSGLSKKLPSAAGSHDSPTPLVLGKLSKSSKDDDVAGKDVAEEFPGPATHEPTDFTDPSGSYDKVLKDDVIPAPLGQVYSMIFGPSSFLFMSKFLTDNQKVFDLQLEDKRGLGPDVKSRTYNYIRPLNASIGPKQTKCITCETLDFFDLEKAVCVTLSTQSPDVPSGNVFTVKTKYTLTWAKNNATRVHVSCMVEWSGKSWFKGPIEKGSNDGQLAYTEDLLKAVKAAISAQSRGLSASSKNGKGSKSKRKREPTKEPEAVAEKATTEAQQRASSWGVFEPLHSPLSAVCDMLKPLLTGNLAVIVILILAILVWCRSPNVPANHVHPAHLSLHDRIALYEDLWLRQEHELWEWLEERVGLNDHTYLPSQHESRNVQNNRVRRQLANAERTLDAHIEMGRMSQQEMEEAIRLTQARLEVLQKAVQKRGQNVRDTKDITREDTKDHTREDT
ncbi:hypothetical protein KEM54_000701 [Ascosphaera aggregata]|nr:hypothetical protein KEM54_000701 [Ascosphaera aggregata]